MPPQKKVKMIEEDKKLYCVCLSRNDGNSFMLGCDLCPNWFHGDCVNIKENEVPDKWYCDSCSALNKNRILIKKDLEELLSSFSSDHSLQGNLQASQQHAQEILALRSMMDEKDKTIERITKEGHETKSGFQLLQDNFQSTSSRMQEEITSLKSLLEEKDKTIERITEEVDDTKRAFQLLQHDFEGTFSSKAELQKEITSLRSTLDEKEKIITQLKQYRNRSGRLSLNKNKDV